jgi:two-component system chemotaxis response regulator CheB
MMRSLTQTLGGHVLGIILTGMGSDGLAGARQMVEAGGTLIAQDEATSVVWGMPGAVATAGLCAAVLPLPELAPYVVQMFEKSVS